MAADFPSGRWVSFKNEAMIRGMISAHPVPDKPEDRAQWSFDPAARTLALTVPFNPHMNKTWTFSPAKPRRLELVEDGVRCLYTIIIRSAQEIIFQKETWDLWRKQYTFKSRQYLCPLP